MQQSGFSKGIMASPRGPFQADCACCLAGNGGFFIISANATMMQHDFFTLGSLYSQCTVTSFADKTKPPMYSDNCALGQPNACCNNAKTGCYKK